jgi:hypothetical protein
LIEQAGSSDCSCHLLAIHNGDVPFRLAASFPLHIDGKAFCFVGSSFAEAMLTNEVSLYRILVGIGVW